MNKRNILALCLGLAMLQASALQIEVSPGNLHESLAALANTVDTKLVLTGSADVRDLALLKEMSRTITNLDMGALEIVGYSYDSGDYLGQSRFAAGELPKAMLLSSKVEGFVFPANATKIGSSAFASSALATVTVPATVTEIGDNAWQNCQNLTTASLPADLTLGQGAFRNCRALQTVTFAGTVTEIPQSTFDGCSSLVSNMPESVTSVGAYAYRGTALTTLDLWNVQTIGDFAFAEMPRLTEVSVNLNVENGTQFGTGVFFGDTGLESLPEVASLSPLMLAGTAGGDKLTVNTPVVAEAAYANNPSIKEITLGSRVSEIKANAFRNVSELNLVNASQLGDKVPEVDPTAFSGLEDANNRYDIELNVKKGAKEEWEKHPVWSLFNITSGGADSGAVTLTPRHWNVKREGDTVTVLASGPLDFVGVYSADGKVLGEYSPQDDFCSIGGIDPGEVIIVKAMQGESLKVVKLTPSN